MDVPADCQRCGACCFSPAPHFVRVTGADWTRLGADAERLAHFAGRGHEAFMRMRDGHCAALEVRGGAEFFCSIYERRPQTCRDLGRGSPECRGELALKKGGAAGPQAAFNPSSCP